MSCIYHKVLRYITLTQIQVEQVLKV
jgi:hypothetical protein